MNKAFEIEFHDEQKILFSDVIDFEEDQIEEIKDIALTYTQKELYWKQTGIPLQNELTNDQKKVVIALKDRVVNNKNADQLIRMKLVKVLPHALRQLLERPKKGEMLNNEYVVDKLITTDRVKKALFKGYPQLSYTMYSRFDPDQFEIPISFVVKRGRPTKVLIITVYFAEAEDTHTVNTIGDGDKNKEVLKALYLKMQQNR
ncbi:MAG: hypothetical protein ABS949_12055 [Solibacillus sp.]